MLIKPLTGGKCINYKADINCTGGVWPIGIIQDESNITAVKNITNSSQCRPAKTIKRDYYRK